MRPDPPLGAHARQACATQALTSAVVRRSLEPVDRYRCVARELVRRSSQAGA